MTLKTLLITSALTISGCMHDQPGIVPKTADTPAQTNPNDAEPRAVALGFVEATEHHDFEAVYLTLSSKLRDRYTPARLRADFEAEPLATERIDRIRASLSKPFTVTATTAVLQGGETRALKLVREEGAWRILEIE